MGQTVVAEVTGLGVEASFDRLAACGPAARRPLSGVATDVVGGLLEVDELQPRGC